MSAGPVKLKQIGKQTKIPRSGISRSAKALLWISSMLLVGLGIALLFLLKDVKDCNHSKEDTTEIPAGQSHNKDAGDTLREIRRIQGQNEMLPLEEHRQTQISKLKTKLNELNKGVPEIFDTEAKGPPGVRIIDKCGSDNIVEFVSQGKVLGYSTIGGYDEHFLGRYALKNEEGRIIGFLRAVTFMGEMYAFFPTDQGNNGPAIAVSKIKQSPGQGSDNYIYDYSDGELAGFPLGRLNLKERIITQLDGRVAATISHEAYIPIYKTFKGCVQNKHGSKSQFEGHTHLRFANQQRLDSSVSYFKHMLGKGEVEPETGQDKE